MFKVCKLMNTSKFVIRVLRDLEKNLVFVFHLSHLLDLFEGSLFIFRRPNLNIFCS